MTTPTPRDILCDTGALTAAFVKREMYHNECAAYLSGVKSQLFLTEATVTETDYMIGERGNPADRHAFRDAIGQGTFKVINLTDQLRLRALEIVSTFTTLDYADATIVAVAEETGILQVFTIDVNDFRTVCTRDKRFLAIVPLIPGR